MTEFIFTKNRAHDKLLPGQLSKNSLLWWGVVREYWQYKEIINPKVFFDTPAVQHILMGEIGRDIDAILRYALETHKHKEAVDITGFIVSNNLRMGPWGCNFDGNSNVWESNRELCLSRIFEAMKEINDRFQKESH